MMSTSSNAVVDQAAANEPSLPVTSFAYRDIATPASFRAQHPVVEEPESDPAAAKARSDQEVKSRLDATWAQAASETEARLRTEYEGKAAQQAAGIQQAIEHFQRERRDYFSRVEVEVIQLVLAIAKKILHREVQVDPMLLSALVRVAIDKLHDGSSVSVRVSPSEAGKWRTCLAHPVNGAVIEIIEDANLVASDCVLETELGSANFSIEAQMKEVERGFFDLLAQRPDGQ